MDSMAVELLLSAAATDGQSSKIGYYCYPSIAMDLGQLANAMGPDSAVVVGHPRDMQEIDFG